jgi:hypothetical protein
MPYPRELVLDAETETRLISYLREELVRHYFERQPAIDEMMTWQQDYWAKPAQEIKTFPFRGAANIVIPITAIAVETIHARIMTTLFGVRPFVSAKCIGPIAEDAEKPLERLIDTEILEHGANGRKAINDSIEEGVKFGTMIAKTGWEEIIKKAVRPRAGMEDEEFPVVIRRGPTVDAVSQSRFLFPFTSKDPQLDAWVGEEHSEGPYRVKLLEESGFFRKGTYEKLYNWVQQASVGTPPALARQYERDQEKIEKRESHWPRRIDWAELQGGFDVDGDGQEEEIVVHYHIASQTIMSVRYNWYEDLHRSYRTGVYFPVENRWRGIGICKMNEQFQRELTTMHRQRLDNATMANMRMIKVHKLSGYGPGEPIFPGKMWFLDDMEHMEAVQMSEVYQSAFANEQGSLIYSQQRTGVNEVTLGMPQVGTPGTATGDIARLQESGKKFDFMMDNIKQFISGIACDTLVNIAQFGVRHVEYLQWAEGADKLRDILTLPTTLLRDNILFEIAAISQQKNKVVDRQNWLQISQVLQNYYTGMLQLAQAGMPQLIGPIAQRGMLSATEALKQFLESMDVRNIDRIAFSEIERILQNAGAQAGTVPEQGGGQPTSPNGGALPGMDIFAQIARLASAGGNGGVSNVPNQ